MNNLKVMPSRAQASKKIIFVLIAILFLNLSLVSAHEHDFNETKQLIDSGISCDKLTDEQLEFIGDYYMEQMHSGEIHVIMDEMMGGEGSETLKEAHINMARAFYCWEHQVMSLGMMNMMMGRTKGGMMGMMGYGNGYGMMGYGGYWSFYNVLLTILLIGLVVLVYLWIWKLWKSIKTKKR